MKPPSSPFEFVLLYSLTLFAVPSVTGLITTCNKCGVCFLLSVQRLTPGKEIYKNATSTVRTQDPTAVSWPTSPSPPTLHHAALTSSSFTSHRWTLLCGKTEPRFTPAIYIGFLVLRGEACCNCSRTTCQGHS